MLLIGIGMIVVSWLIRLAMSEKRLYLLVYSKIRTLLQCVHSSV